jgi:rRNA 2'-O-methyltransferase fibrillarin (EC 2.1.1.-)
MYREKRWISISSNSTRSIDVTKDPNQIINQEMKKLENDFEICEKIDLRPFDKDHAMVIAKSIN